MKYRILYLIAVGAIISGPLWGGDLEDMGFTRLQSELGAATPSGLGISVILVEASEAAPPNDFYMPNTNHVEFIGKKITNLSGVKTNASTHATNVGRHLFGNNTSMATNISIIDVMTASNWVTSVYLKPTLPTGPEPGVLTNRIHNCSWIQTNIPPVYTTNILQRLDYVINRDNVLIFAGLNNGYGTTVPQVPAQAYNSICIGRNDGLHSAGFTTLDGVGRVKPDLVSAAGAISYALPKAGAASAMLLETAESNPLWYNATNTECVKAILMAGATKKEFPSWDRTTGRPLDEQYGAGELNIYNSYRLITAGEHDADDSNDVTHCGWDWGWAGGAITSRYFFTIQPGEVVVSLSALLTWNRDIIDANPGLNFTPSPIMPDFDLRLWSASNYVIDVELDVSTSAVDNVEHIYQSSLAAGEYALEVVSDTATNYALAWHSKRMIEPEIESSAATGTVAALSFNVTTGFTYITEVSTNILNANGWLEIETNLITASPYYFEDTVPSQGSKFYRVIPHP